mmetsp:Transcript_310/g.705  ORF Transcript_310/g.705 Transcript_310/m.705 type:complete len:255 (+) Transcript_310:979-1743(+)
MPGGGAHDHLGLAVAVDVADGGPLRDEAAQVALPHLLAAPVEDAHVAADVARHDLRVPVVVHVGHHHLPLHLAHLDREARAVGAVGVEGVDEPDGGANHNLQLAVAIDVRHRGGGVHVRAEGGRVRRQVQVRLPPHIAGAEVKDNDAAADILADVDVVAQLMMVLERVVVLTIEEIAHRNHEVLAPVPVEVHHHRGAQNVRVHVQILAVLQMLLLLELLALPELLRAVAAIVVVVAAVAVVHAVARLVGIAGVT